MPKISVIMSVYNGEQYLEESIKSVLSQSLSDFEFLIVDDCSTDATRNILQRYACADPRVKIFVNSTNIGLAASLNKLVSRVEGEYIARMDADDICFLNRFERQILLFDKHPNIDFVFSGTQLIECSGKKLCTSWRPNNIYCIKILMKYICYIPHPTVMVRAQVLKEYNYNESCRTGQDQELWIRLISAGVAIKYDPSVLLKYRINSKSVRSNCEGISRKYFDTCINNGNKIASFRYYKNLTLLEKLYCSLKLVIPFHLLVLKGIVIRKLRSCNECFGQRIKIF